MKTLTITQAEALALLDYNFETGELRWKERTEDMFDEAYRCAAWNTRFAGKVAGSVHTNRKTGKQYIHIRVSGVMCLAHRIINLMVTGSTKEIDHIDGNGLNNAWNNLREVTAQENNQNRKRFKNNKTGVTGVSMFNGKYKAEIRHNGKGIYLGLHATLEQATIARKKAERELGFHPNHGRA